MEKCQAEQFVEWFQSRLEQNQSLTFGDVSKSFDCSFEYKEEDVFLHFNDESQVVFQLQEDSYIPKFI